MVDKNNCSGSHWPLTIQLGDSEVVLPVELGIPSPRITFYDHDDKEEVKKVNLDLLPETRGTALLKAISYKLKLTRLFNRRVKHRPFQVNDWVLRKFEATGREPMLGKLQPNWKGPYRVTSMVPPAPVTSRIRKDVRSLDHGTRITSVRFMSKACPSSLGAYYIKLISE